MWNCAFLVLVCLAIAVFALGTHPTFRIPRVQNNFSGQALNVLTPTNLTNVKFRLYSSTSRHPVLTYIDQACLLIFSVEGILRFIVCPDKWKFAKNFLNAMDFLYLFTSWIVFIIDFTVTSLDDYKGLLYTYIIFKLGVILRFFRFFRLVQNYEGMRLMSLTLTASFKELFLLCLFLIVGTIVFASVIYYAEFQEDTFLNIPIALWWAIITMTSVGYGDYYPVSVPGQIVASACAIAGIVILALPIPIISANFTIYRTYFKLRKRMTGGQCKEGGYKMLSRRALKFRNTAIQPRIM